jgi:methionine synthase I (cobalamin-dependent)
VQREVVVVDGALDTSVQTRNLAPINFSGEMLNGCNDYLVVRTPHLCEACFICAHPESAEGPAR